MTDVVAYSSRHISSEHALPAACSASCYNLREDVGILPVIVPEGEFRQVQRQVVLAHLMKSADHAALQQAPKGFQVVGVHVPAHIFFLAVIHRFMRECLVKCGITGCFISGNQGHGIAHGLTDEVAHGQSVGVLDRLTDDIALASDGPNDGHLGAAAFTCCRYSIHIGLRRHACGIGSPSEGRT